MLLAAHADMDIPFGHPKPAGTTFSTVTDMYNYLATYVPARSTQTAQEWEMADDLGDSHAKSLKQGGKLPDNSTTQRNVGRIYTATSQVTTCKVYPEVDGRTLNVAIYNASGTTLLVQTTGVATAAAPLTVTYNSPSDKWLTIKVKNSTATQLGQKVWVNVTYTAPASVNTRTSPGNLQPTMGNAVDRDAEQLVATQAAFTVYPNPTTGQVYFTTEGISDQEDMRLELFNLQGQRVMELHEHLSTLQTSFNQSFSGLKSGLYVLQVRSASLRQEVKLVKM